MLIEIFKDAKLVAEMVMDENGMSQDISTDDPTIMELWNNGVFGVRSKEFGPDGTLVVRERFQKGDRQFSFNFLSALKTVYGYTWREVA